ncbi:hypothetical protein SO802_007423 [Lithocarpus litseifolius]|uniref:WAT1-related protein n=1 Tax=Lithocarpus litseifolius TaxID=425828 RepID=A0AAW2DNK5_9ROSI
MKRMEKLDLKKLRCQAKLLGTIVTVAGAILISLYQGPMLGSKHNQTHEPYTKDTTRTSGKNYFKGSILVIIATLSWSGLFVLQALALKTYKNHQLSLTSLICFVGTLQAIAVTFVVEHKPSVWKIGFDMNLLAAAYAGIVTSSISYYVQGLVIKKKGPVFASAFSPLMMIIVAFMGSFILKEIFFVGGIVGSILIVMGLYSVLWGKHKESIENKVEEIPDVINSTKVNGDAISKNEDIEADEIEMGKGKGDKLSSMAITMPMKGNQDTEP